MNKEKLSHYVKAKRVAIEFPAGFSLKYAVDHLFSAREFAKGLTSTQRRKIMRKESEIKEILEAIEVKPNNEKRRDRKLFC